MAEIEFDRTGHVDDVIPRVNGAVTFVQHAYNVMRYYNDDHELTEGQFMNVTSMETLAENFQERRNIGLLPGVLRGFEMVAADLEQGLIDVANELEVVGENPRIGLAGQKQVANRVAEIDRHITAYREGRFDVQAAAITIVTGAELITTLLEFAETPTLLDEMGITEDVDDEE